MATTGTALVDTRVLGRPSTWDGDETRWEEWSFQMRSWISCLAPNDGANWLAQAETATAPVTMAALVSDDARAFSTAVFHVLVMSLKAAPSLTLRRVDLGNGLEAWRQLTERYAGTSRGRQFALLSRILRPEAFPHEAKACEEALGMWEIDIRDYEAASEAGG